ncbi:outer membrane receptor protein involved in Fe transport [Endobacter medicaginis]|uniref:Outer membrane receptor protein involved in Fe transport n=1 Tax=Endobacter medicaginis TaxID=1181271 RepID=A0A839V1G9_9PROT|nr:TonB-dependent receptor [Endobacter medicaginis]MBB3174695.1 outer membrane receptor protein involved in Fe transport [Endobacter medicaginis]MCX5474910.1 TonB-dependent receptor [Endobacter medicaginis]NVN30447.1 TonB-dependent receptor [Endobacter medicaginis]
MSLLRPLLVLSAAFCVARSSLAEPPRKKPATTTQNIVVTGSLANAAGGGNILPQTETRSVSTVSQAAIERAAPTLNAYQLVARLPGANVAMSDPYGLSQQLSITVRGFTQDQIGYVLEGMPLGDMGYYNGYPSQFADSENLRSVSFAQGAADLDSPVVNAAGGLLTLSFRDPATRPGGEVSYSYGTYRAQRVFARADTGTLGASGIRAFLSYSHTVADNWRGPGRDWRDHVDFKAVREWGEGTRIALAGTYHDAYTSSYPEVTADQWHADGIGGQDNYAGDYATGGTGYWKLYAGTYHLIYLSAPSDLRVNSAISLHATPYFQFGYGNSPGGTTIATSGLFQGAEALPYTLDIPGAQDGQANVVGNYTGQQYRTGWRPSLDWRWRGHRFVLGYWGEYDHEQDRQSFGLIGDDGTPGNAWDNAANARVLLPDGRALLASDTGTITRINMIFVGDTWTVPGTSLTLQAGFKQAWVTRDGTNHLPGPQYRSSITDSAPLPRIGARWQITARHQLFLSATTNFRTPAQSTLFDVYDPSSGEVISAANTDLRREYAISEEFGYRYSGDWLIGSIAFFNANLTNHQVATVIDLNGALVGATVNAGGETSRGVDIELGTKPWHHVSPYVSAEYLHATMDNDFTTGEQVLPTAGKRAVGSPSVQLAASLTYDDGRLFGSIGGKYVGRQYATFMNDERLPGRATGDIALGWRLDPRRLAGREVRPQLRLNVLNFTDAHFRSGIASPTSNALDTAARDGSTVAGSAPTFYIGGGFAAMITASAGF